MLRFYLLSYSATFYAANVANLLSFFYYLLYMGLKGYTLHINTLHVSTEERLRYVHSLLRCNRERQMVTLYECLTILW